MTQDKENFASTSFEQLFAALSPAREDLPRVPQQARSREKRDELTKAAARLFIERGYEETTSDDIAQQAGVSVGTFYKYFRNKRQILLTLVLEQIESIFSNLHLSQLDFSQGNYYTEIRRALKAALGNTQPNNGLKRVWLELMARDQELVPYQQLVRQQILNQLEENLRRVAAQSLTWPDLDIEATAILILTLLDNINLNSYNPVSDERMLDSLTNMIYRAIFPPEQV